ncbi:hypothetical protein ACIOEX_01715 [Streptomyces sp. NPDC087850]|uniref:hypothetical protein n=1 Tax=Streptomyces sp. NPDC087850 TaxID=3365809 RepID=UPI00381FEB68
MPDRISRRQALAEALIQDAAQLRSAMTPEQPDDQRMIPAEALKLLRFGVRRLRNGGIENADYFLTLIDHVLDEQNMREHVDGLDRDERQLRERVEIAEASSRELAAIVAPLRAGGIIDAAGRATPYVSTGADAAVQRVRQLHRPVDYRDLLICAACSSFDGVTCDSSPCGYEHCPTLKAIKEPSPRLLDCGFCHEEQGEEVHPHPECPVGQPATDGLHARIAAAVRSVLYQDLPGDMGEHVASAVLASLANRSPVEAPDA